MSRVVGNLFWGNHLRCFLYKTALNGRQVLFRLFCIKTTQSTTAITSIVFHAIRRFGTNLKYPSLRDESIDSPKQSKKFRHTERSEVSKTGESNKIAESMIEKRIDESDSTLQHCDSYNFDSRDLDCFGDKSPRNDGVKNIAESHNNKSHAQRLSLAF